MPGPARARVLAHLRFLGREMGSVSRAVARSLDLHQTQLQAIELLLRRPRLAAGELARRLGISTGATTALVDHLEKRDWLRRLRDPGDRRRVVLEVTQQARAAWERAFGDLGARVEQVTNGYDDDELAVICRFLRDVRAAIGDYERALDAGGTG